MEPADVLRGDAGRSEKGNAAPEFWRLLRVTFVEAYRDNLFGIAKGAAYSGLIAFFPVMTTLATLLVQTNAAQVARTIAGFLYQAVPPGAEDVVQRLFTVHNYKPGYVLVGAVLVAAWAGSGAVLSLMEGFRAAYDIPTGRGFWKDRLAAVLLVFVTLVPVWAASAAIVMGATTEKRVIAWLGLLPESSVLPTGVALVGQALRYLVAFGTFVLVTSLVYYLGPNRKQVFRQVVPGAVLATFLWLIATVGFSWWVRHVANFNLLYGSVGAGLALLAWMYVLAVITLYGCEFNAVRERGEGEWVREAS